MRENNRKKSSKMIKYSSSTNSTTPLERGCGSASKNMVKKQFLLLKGVICISQNA
jgi:hypothetical protein